MTEPAGAPGSEGSNDHDPFAPLDASPRFATPLALGAFVLAGLTLFSGLAALTGVLGMALGLIAHVKHSRLGLPASFASGLALVLAMTAAMYQR
jgi:hypothetical protein